MFSIRNNDKYIEEVKYSKFISLIFRVTNKNEVSTILQNIKKEYLNASHYCYGYVIDNEMKSSDDKEPSSTAGIQILNQIKSNNLNYVLIVVIRYFKGVKLGIGPLSRTYAKMAKEVIKKDNIIRLIKGYDIDLIFDYNDIKTIDYILKESIIVSKRFDKNIIYNVKVTKDILDKLNNYNIKINKDVYIEKKEDIY